MLLQAVTGWQAACEDQEFSQGVLNKSEDQENLKKKKNYIFVAGMLKTAFLALRNSTGISSWTSQDTHFEDQIKGT